MKTQLFLSLAAVFASCVFLSSFASAQQQEESAYIKSVVLSGTSTGELVSIPLDQEMYSKSLDSWQDIRLLNIKEEEVPYLLHRQVTEERKSQRRTTLITKPQVRPTEDNGLEITFTIDREKHPSSIDGIVLSTPIQDFEHRVSVETRAESEEAWRPLVTNALIYDYSRYMDVRNLEVPFTQKSSNTQETQFRILIEKVTQEKESSILELTRTMKDGVANENQEKLFINRENLKLNSVSFWHDIESVVSTEPVLSEYSIQVDSRREDEKLKSTVIEFLSHREPLTCLELATEDRNFSREVTLYALQDDSSLGNQSSKEQYLTSSVITQLSLPSNTRSDLTIKFPATRSNRYRLVIENGDSPPLKEITMRAKGETYELLYLREANEKYSVTYGNPLLDAPKYDVLAIQTAVDLKVAPQLGSLEKSRAYKLTDPRSEFEKTLENKWLIGILFAALILVLAATLYQASKRLSSIPH